MILMYHNIAVDAGFNTVARDALAAQLDFIAASFRTVDLDSYVAALEHGARGCATVTFDDAYESFAEHALPELEVRGIPATVFVPVEHVGGVNDWDAGRGGPVLRVMTWERIADLAENPLVTVGSHGLVHRSMGGMTIDEVSRGIRESKRILDERFGGHPVRYFSFPYGRRADYTDHACRELESAGYEAACSTRFGRLNRPGDRYTLRRIEVEPGDDILSFRRKCLWPLHPKLFRQAVRDILPLGPRTG